MPAIFGIDSRSFDAVVILERFPLDEFVLTATDVPPALNLPDNPIAGWVTVNRRSNGIARTYDAGTGCDWVAGFKRDLIAGTFGKPAERRAVR